MIFLEERLRAPVISSWDLFFFGYLFLNYFSFHPSPPLPPSLWNFHFAYILSTSGFGPCIFPTMVPFFEFFTQPRMPAFMQLSWQNFVNPTPKLNRQICVMSQWSWHNVLLHLWLYLERDQTLQNHTELIRFAHLSHPSPFYAWNAAEKNKFHFLTFNRAFPIEPHELNDDRWSTLAAI